MMDGGPGFMAAQDDTYLQRLWMIKAKVRFQIALLADAR
jgi:hypothetical protein